MKPTTLAFCLLTAAALPATLPGPVAADDTDVIRAFYDTLLTTPADVTRAEIDAVVSQDWVTIPGPRPSKGAAGLEQTLAGFGAIIPDLTWTADEILRDGNRYIVRGTARGTPAQPFLGISPASGQSFEIMSIDIHTVENGRITQSYHVEDWAGAMRQLAGE